MRVFALLAVLATCTGFALAAAPEASAARTWSDGTFSEVYVDCRSYGLSTTNASITHSSIGVGFFYYRIWERRYPSGAWIGPSDFRSPSILSYTLPVGAQWQFYVELWHRLPSGRWESHAEWGYVIQNGIKMGYGSPCTT